MNNAIGTLLWVCTAVVALDYFKRRISIDTVNYATKLSLDWRNARTTNKEIIIVIWRQITRTETFPMKFALSPTWGERCCAETKQKWQRIRVGGSDFQLCLQFYKAKCTRMRPALAFRSSQLFRQRIKMIFKLTCSSVADISRLKSPKTSNINVFKRRKSSTNWFRGMAWAFGYPRSRSERARLGMFTFFFTSVIGI